MDIVKEDLNKKVQTKRNIEILKNSPGWRELEAYLTSRECKLLRLIMKGKIEDLKSHRDRLNELQDFKKFLNLTLSDGEAAIKELDLYDRKFGQAL